MDLVVRHVRIVDGSGAASYVGDLGVEGGRIARVWQGQGRRPAARRVLDAHGLVAAPGFIDMHAHSDLARLTGRPAARLRLPDRGLIREGYRADLVLFDPATVASGASYEQPRRLPTGIPHVLIDGRFVIEDGRRTDVLAGRSVRGAGRP